VICGAEEGRGREREEEGVGEGESERMCYVERKKEETKKEEVVDRKLQAFAYVYSAVCVVVMMIRTGKRGKERKRKTQRDGERAGG